MNDHLDMTHPSFGTWRIRAREHESEEASGERYRALVDENLYADEGNFSLWRTTNLERDRWLLIACGRPERVDPLDLGGKPYQLTKAEAQTFFARRVRIALEAMQENPLAEEFTQLEHYEEGVVLDKEGNARSLP